MKKHTPEIIALAARERRAAYTLLLQVYAEVRQACRFVCRHDQDFEKIALSLYRRRAVKRRRSIDKNGAAAEPSLAAPAAATAPVPAGFPGADPFMNHGEDQLH